MKIIIDVSEHQGKFDWESWKDKIDGAILRTGYGKDLTTQDDKQFARNATECERLGIPYGVYHYSYATTTANAKLEASHCFRLIRNRKLSLPVFYDIEEQRVRNVAKDTFIAFKEQLSDYKVGLYTGESYYNSYMQGVKPDFLWIAKYGTNDGTPQKKPVLKDKAKYQLWQYSSRYMGKNLDVSQVISEDIFLSKDAKTDYEVALEVLDGKWGSGDSRKTALTEAGYSYASIQHLVNVIILARNVIAGKYGNGTERKQKITKMGYSYTEVQQMVNKILAEK